MVIAPRSNEISCLIKNVRITINKALIHQILELEICDTQIFLHKVHPTFNRYNTSDACRIVTGNDFENFIRISANQLTLSCKVLQYIIAHVILPRKGHRD